MTRPTGKPIGRPAKYVKPLMRTYRVSAGHCERVVELRGLLTGSRSDSDVIEEAVIRLHKRYVPTRRREKDASATSTRRRLDKHGK